MNYLSVDFETRSTIELTDTGVYPYAQHESTDIWCMAWAIEDREPSLWRPGEDVPEELWAWVIEGKALRAWNANFERVIWREILGPRYGFPVPELEQWYCTAADARAMALPGSLDECAIALRTEHQKDQSGKRLMLQMSKPRKVDDEGNVTWWSVPDKMQRLYDYCLQDVRTERSIFKMIRPLPDQEREIYLMDQRINDRGILIDMPLAMAARDVAEIATDKANDRLAYITAGMVKAVTQATDMRGWLGLQGVHVDSIDKANVRELLRQNLPARISEVLEIREQFGKSSVKKIDRMITAACSDARVRGTLLYHGAGTGRWSGRLIQPQNFPRPMFEEDPEIYIPDVLKRDVDMLDLIHPPMNILSSMLRSMLCAAEGHDLIAADFSAIEARVIAWLADEKWRLEVFRTHGKIYEASAAMMFKVPFETIAKGQENYGLRQKGKVSELALGYQGGPNALIAMGAIDMGLQQEELKPIVDLWRKASPKIVEFWRDLNDAALLACETPGQTFAAAAGRIKFTRSRSYLQAELPNGKRLFYAFPEVFEKETPWGSVQKTVRAWGVNSVTKKWQLFDIYGGLLAENIVQAVARELLAEAMLRLEAAGYRIVMSVHDEIVCEEPCGSQRSLDEMIEIMCDVPAWADGLPLKAEGWQNCRFRK